MRGRHRRRRRGRGEARARRAAPRQAAVRAPQLAEPGGHAGHGARGRADGVVDELGAERHLEVQQLRLARRHSEPRHGAEAVEVAHARRSCVEHDRVPAAEQPGHHRLGDARREPRRHRGIDGRAAVLEDLDPGRGGRGMAGRDACSHCSTRGSASQPIRPIPGAREVEAVAHQPAARVAVDAAADRLRAQARPVRSARRVTGSVSLSCDDQLVARLLDDRLASSSTYRPATACSDSSRPAASRGLTPGRDSGGPAASPSCSTTRRTRPLPRQLFVSTASASRSSGTSRRSDW